MRLLGFMFHSPMNHTILSWAHPESTQGTEFARPEFWQRIARTLERGKFDGLFLADTFAPYDLYRDSYETTVKYAVVCPQHDPVVLIPVMAVATLTYFPFPSHRIARSHHWYVQILVVSFLASMSYAVILDRSIVFDVLTFWMVGYSLTSWLSLTGEERTQYRRVVEAAKSPTSAG